MKLKKFLSFFYSMRFAIALLVVLALACALGSVVRQGQEQAFYAARYGDALTHWILALGVDDLYSAPWFLALSALLMLNLLLCSVLRFPKILALYRSGFSMEKWDPARDATFALALGRMPDAFFARMGFRNISTEGERGYAVRGRVGVWGAWLCHLGMLVVALGFALGSVLLLETSVYGVPGSTRPVEGTPYEVTIDDFNIALREDDTVEQYTATLTVRDTQTGETVHGVSQVNHPLSAFGMTLYQNSVGWAADVRAYRGDALLNEAALCAGEHIELSDLPLALVFHALYPDYYNDGTGPGTRSSRLDNPAMLFSLFYDGKLVDMNVAGLNYDIAVDDYRFVFSNPRHYTLIQIVRDPALGVAFAGGALIVLGILIAFYLRTEEIMFVKEPGRVLIYGKSLKGAALYAQKARDCLRKEGIDHEPI